MCRDGDACRHLEVQRQHAEPAFHTLGAVPGNLLLRQRAQKYYSDTPLNRLVDAALPESEAGRTLESLADKPFEHANEIKTLLTRWQENEGNLNPLLESNLLQEIKPLAKTMAELCAKGLEALSYIQSNQTPSLEWIKESSALINRAEKPQGH